MNTTLGILSVAALAGLLASLPLTPPAAHTPAAETFAIDNGHSTVVFHAKHLGISEAYGRFNRLSDKSQVVLDPDLTKSSILVVVEAESVDTNNGDRDKHLRSADFFNAKEFPEIVFESQKISGTEQALEVSGKLTFHGVTKTVTAKAHKVGKSDTPFGDHRAGFVAELKVNMQDFGVEFLNKNPGAVGPEVSLTISLECIRE